MHFAQEHEAEIKLYRLAKRKLSACCDVEKAIPVRNWQEEINLIESEKTTSYAKYKPLREETQILWKIKHSIEQVETHPLPSRTMSLER